jgi:hypothetical protein
MGVKMIHAVFMVAITIHAVPEIQTLIIHFSSSANSTPVKDYQLRLFSLKAFMVEIRLPIEFHPFYNIPAKEQNEVQDRAENRYQTYDRRSQNIQEQKYCIYNG